MGKSRINAVLAANLKHYMGEAGIKQEALAAKSGVGQTTISLYLRPEKRQASASVNIHLHRSPFPPPAEAAFFFVCGFPLADILHYFANS